ncbi:unnamed protein product [Calypogeia fissa]
MAAPFKESSLLSALQRAAFEKWKASRSYMKERSYPTSNVAGEDFDCHVDVTLDIQEDGNVNVLLNVSGRNEPPYANQSQNVLDVPRDMQTSPHQPEFPYKGHTEGGLQSDTDLCRPQKLYMYFLELQRLKGIKDIEPNPNSKCGSPKIAYDGGLSELQRAAFEKWSNDEEMDQFATIKFASLNLKDDDSMQPSMGTLKGDTNSVLEPELVLNKVEL